MNIKPLSQKTLESSIKLVDSIFPNQGNEPANITFRASLNREYYKKFLQITGITFLRYWVIEENNDVIAVIGIYTYKKDEKEAAWVGWFCIDPKFRGKGLGNKLLLKVVNEAKKMKKKYLRLYTSTSDIEKNAQFFYDKLGFKEYKRTELKDYPGIFLLYKQLRLY